MTDTVFGKIARGEIPTDFLYEDDLVVAFRDIQPEAPTHILVIPRKGIVNLAEADDADAAVLGHMLRVCAKIAVKEGIAENGYRVVTNVGKEGGQSVFHLHMHILGGRQMTWPPG